MKHVIKKNLMIKIISHYTHSVHIYTKYIIENKNNVQ